MLGDAGAAAVADALRDHRRAWCRRTRASWRTPDRRGGSDTRPRRCRRRCVPHEAGRLIAHMPRGSLPSAAGTQTPGFRRCRSGRRRRTRSRSRRCRRTSCSAQSAPLVHVRSVDAASPLGRIPPVPPRARAPRRCRRAAPRAARMPAAAPASVPAPPADAAALPASGARRRLAAGARQPPHGVAGAERVLAAARRSDERTSDASDATAQAPSGPSRTTASVRARHDVTVPG